MHAGRKRKQRGAGDAYGRGPGGGGALGYARVVDLDHDSQHDCDRDAHPDHDRDSGACVQGSSAHSCPRRSSLVPDDGASHHLPGVRRRSRGVRG
jgi:hypothetical protein